MSKDVQDFDSQRREPTAHTQRVTKAIYRASKACPKWSIQNAEFKSLDYRLGWNHKEREMINSDSKKIQNI